MSANNGGNMAAGMMIGMALGHSAGRASGQREATEEFDAIEEQSVARVLAGNEKFVNAVREAHDQVREECRNLDRYVNNEKVVPIAKTGLFWLFNNEATGAEAHAIKSKARQILSENIDVKGADLSDEYILDVARSAATYSEDFHGQGYEMGQAAEFVMGLQSTDYRRMGYMAAVYDVLAEHEELSADRDAVKALLEEKAPKNEHEGKLYRRHLADAVQKYAGQVHERLDGLYKQAWEKLEREGAVKAAPATLEA